jgi:fructose-1,6-bisphosphatase-3
MKDTKYLSLLSKSFPTISATGAEIINLEAILNLPKGTEHFVTDLHGEFEAFNHVVKNASGVIRKKVEDIFGHRLRESEKRELCTLIYYPEKKLQLIKLNETEIEDWYKAVLIKLIAVCRNVSSKYTRSKVRKALPKEFSYIIQELLHESSVEPNKQAYLNSIINTIVSTGSADNFIIEICKLIQRLTIDSLHIIGDIYDRGQGAHLIMDLLCEYHNVDFQWGNHDVVWMGAAAGSKASMANVIRMSLRYANLETLEDGYGISLLPLATFAMETYNDDPCSVFKPKLGDAEGKIKQKQVRLLSQMHKAITIIQFKLEGAVIKRNPDFEMEDRMLLQNIDFKKGTVNIGGVEYILKDTNFPTINPADPYLLTEEEKEVVNKLMQYFQNSEKFNKHIKKLYSNGSLYLVRNSNLLYHGSVPLNPDGTLKSVKICGEELSGKKLFDKIDLLVRLAYFADSKHKLKQYGQDFLWYLWCGPYSPPFDKNKMATFERYFLTEKELHKETKGNYNYLKDNREICEMILKEFGVNDPYSHIVNGHIPVKTAKGESPIKAGGKLLVIDGGFSKAYQQETGIAGFTLIYNSHGMLLVQHEPFESAQKAIEEGHDIISETSVIDFTSNRKMVKDTDIGQALKQQVDDLKMLLEAYKGGLLKEVI